MLEILNSSTKDTLVNVLTNVNLWGAIIATIFVISLGYILVKTKVFKADWKTALNNVVLKVALPALALKGFMTNCNQADLVQYGIVLGIGFGFYIFLILVAELWIKLFPKLLPKMVKRTNGQVQFQGNGGTLAQQVTETGEISTTGDEKRALVMWMMLIFGSTTFFGLQIIKSLYEHKGGVITANLWNIPYRIFLYSYCFMAMGSIEFNKGNFAKSMKTAFLNPIVIATFVGLICY